jgi:hypothetical protein
MPQCQAMGGRERLLMRRPFLLLTALSIATTRYADAAPVVDAGRDWAAFSEQASALETAGMQDCELACKALESLSRAAERLCEIEQERCAEAKARLAKVRTQVRTGCPTCAIPTVSHDEAKATPSAPERDSIAISKGESMTSENAPRRGGCASCSLSCQTSPSVVVHLLSLGALMLLRGRRRTPRA